MRLSVSREMSIAPKKERPNDRSLSYCLVSDGETLLVVSGLLQFVDHSHGIVLDGDVTCACCRVNDEVVFAQAEFARALTLIGLFKGTGR